MIPGEMQVQPGEIELNAGRATLTMTVTNTGDRPIQVGSHYHFAETNPALDFDRAAARVSAEHRGGYRGALRARPEPHRRAGGAGRRAQGVRLQRTGHGGALMVAKISRQAYAEMFGPTVGDRVRLADTELWIEVEGLTIHGEEVKFGGGKVIRDGMGQSQRIAAEVADTVITNALIVDHWGIVKADIGIKDGRIAGIGKAGNPDIQPGVQIVIGPGTEVIAGEGMIITAGGIDSHIHFICPQQIEEALMSGVTTMLGGGTGPATGTTPPPARRGRAYPQDASGLEAFPMNLGYLGKGNASLPGALASRSRPAPSASSCTRTGAPPRRRSTTACRWPSRWTSRSPSTPTPSTSRASSSTPRRPSGSRHPHLPHRGRGRRPCAGHHQAGQPAQRAAQSPPTRPGRTPSTPSTSTSTC